MTNLVITLMLLTQQTLLRLSFSLQAKMLIHEVANKLNKHSSSLWLVSRLACIKIIFLHILFLFQGCECRIQASTSDSSSRINPEKALQGENTTGWISYFDSFLSTTFIGLPFIWNVCSNGDNLFKVWVMYDCHFKNRKVRLWN